MPTYLGVDTPTYLGGVVGIWVPCEFRMCGHAYFCWRGGKMALTCRPMEALHVPSQRWQPCWMTALHRHDWGVTMALYAGSPQRYSDKWYYHGTCARHVQGAPPLDDSHLAAVETLCASFLFLSFPVWCWVLSSKHAMPHTLR